MRPWRRRRPAGRPQVPIPPPPPAVAAPVEPALVRLAVDRGVVDVPWDVAVVSIAHVWPEPRAPGGWARVAWPADSPTGRFVAPLDLQVGHVIEVVAVGGWRCYGWIADADARRFVLAPSPDAGAAVVAAARASAVWHATEVAAVEDAWRERIARARRLHDEAV